MYPRIQRRQQKKIASQPYSGLLSPTGGGQGQRGAYKAPTATSRESIRKGPAQPEQSGGLLGKLDGGVQAGTNIGQMYNSGKTMRKGIDNIPGIYDKATGYVNDTWNGSMLGEATGQLNIPQSSSFSMPDFNMPEMFGGSASATASSIPQPTDFGITDGTINSLGGDMVGADSAFAGGDVSGLAGDSTGAMADGATTGMQSAGTLAKSLPYLKIGYDMISGSDQLTGNAFADGALRTGAAYATAGLSEVALGIANMFEWI